MASKKETNRFVLSASGMKDIHKAPLRKERQGKSKPKGGKNGR